MRILITTFGSLGDLHPYLNIAANLTVAGHTVTVATHSDHQFRIEAEGHRFHRVRPEISADAQFFRKAMDEFTGGRFLVRDLLMPAIRDSYTDLLAAVPAHDLLVTHIATYAGPLVARTTGIPWVSSVLCPLAFFSALDPPVLGTSLIGLRRRAPAVSHLINNLVRRSTRRWAGPSLALERELGHSPQHDPTVDGQHSPRCVLALFSDHFAAKQLDWPAQTVVTGFPLGAPKALPPAIERFLASGPPPIVVTLGSSAVFTPGKVYRAAGALNRRVLLLAGAEAASLPASSNLLAVDYAPHSAVFPHAAAIVHHGGIGTTAEALRSGRPSLMVPFSHDQPDNAARCERLGVARVLSRRKLSAKTLNRELDLLLANPVYAEAAREFASQIRAESGAAEAARLVVHH